MGEWRKTSCTLCPTGCGLEILVEDNRMIKVRGDKDNQRSLGFACRKGLSINYFHHDAQRLTHPLKRVGSSFERISWDQAFKEIAAKIKDTVQKHGPYSLAYAGEARQYGATLIGALGSKNYYSSLAQEVTGEMWVSGLTFGNQGLRASPDYDHTDMMLFIGINPMESNHKMPRAPVFLKKFAKDPNKLLVVIDPRLSDTARIAHIHLAIRPGTDALLLRAMIAIILQEGWHNKDYISQNVSGFEKILPWFSNFDARAAIKVCRLDYENVREVCRLFATRKSSLLNGLGIEMGRHSTGASYLIAILTAICGRIGVLGGNVFLGGLMRMGPPPGKPETQVWKAPASGFPLILGMLPPAVIPEEIMSQKPDRTRVLIAAVTNPLRSWPDTQAYEKACKQLDLMVTIDVVMNETAAASHYVLPSNNCYESWEKFIPFINASFPEIYYQKNQPILKPSGDTLDTSEILLRLADQLGLIPEIPASLVKAAEGERVKFGAETMAYTQSHPEAMRVFPFVLAKTLGRVLGSNGLADLWWSLFTLPEPTKANIARGGFQIGPNLTEELYKALIDHPEGMWVGRSNPESNLMALSTADKRINVFIPDLAEWVKTINPESEAKALEPDPEYPLVFSAGRHSNITVNTQLRNPEWNRGRRACVLAMNPEDAKSMNLTDGQKVRITTEAGSEEVELEVTDSTCPSLVILPHGFGLNYNGKVYGVNANSLTKNTHRDQIVGTPLHRYIPCRIEKIQGIPED
jgi:anaerobic selenocysteine-containing dehydrogenase